MKISTIQKLVYLILINLISIVGFTQSTNCNTATPLNLINGSACDNGTTVGALMDSTFHGFCNPSPITVQMVWFTYTPLGPNNNFTITPGTLTNPEFVLYSGGCPGTPSAVLETCSVASGSNVLNATWGLPIGQQVWIGVASVGGTEGTFDLCVSSTPSVANPGSDCANATNICTFNGFTVNPMVANSSGQTSTCFGSAVQRDVWIKFTVTQSGMLSWTATPVNGNTEYDWTVWDITGGCPGTEFCCNYNYAAGSGAGFGMHTGPGTRPCGYTGGLFDGDNGEFCAPQAVTCGRTYAIQISNYSNNANGFSIDFTGSTCMITTDLPFTPTPDFVCGNSMTVNISNSFTGVQCSTVSWDFGDGSPIVTTTGTNNPPAHTYTTPGTYAITASVAGICNTTHTEYVQLLGPLEATTSTINQGCDEVCDGVATVETVGGGDGVYTYLWSNGATTSSVSGLCAGPYTVTIFNAACASSLDVDVIVDVDPGPVLNITDPSEVCSPNTIDLTAPSITATSSTGTLTYWNDSNATSVNSSPSTINSTGTYYIQLDSAGCKTVLPVNATIYPTPVIDPLANQEECDSYTLPIITGTNLTGNESYYTGPNGTGTALSAGSVITSSQTVYIYDETGTMPNCFDEVSFTVTINPTPVLDAVGDEVACDSYTLPSTITGTNLSGNQAFYDATGGPNGTGNVIPAGSVITSTQTIFVYDETGTTPNCFDEVSFTVTINPTPVLDALGDEVACDSYTLPSTVTGTNLSGNQAFYDATGGPNGTGNVIPAGSIITSTQTIFVYDETGTTPNCFDEVSFTVTINPTPVLDALGDEVACDSYTLPSTITGTNLSGNQAFYDATGGPNGTGNIIPAGSVITSTQTIFVYDETGTTPNCFDEVSFTVTINPTPVLDALGDEVACDSYTLPSTITGTNLSGNQAFYDATGGPNGTGNVIPAGSVITSTQTIFVYDETGTTPNCFDEVSFTVTINPTPVLDAVGDEVACDSYTLPAITGTNLTGNEAYYTGPNGTGTSLAAGDAITSSQTVYIYDETLTTPNCFDETSFAVTINVTPSIDVIGNQIVCDTYTLPIITGSNLTGNESYYTGPNGSGSTIAVGTVISTNQTIYIYDESGTTPNCFDEVSFDVIINGVPSLDAVADQIVCDSYTLPVISGTSLTGNESYYTGPNGTGTELPVGTSLTSNQTVYIYDETGTVPNCFDETSFTITINATPVIDAVSDQEVCDSYTLPLITGTNLTGNESYYTGPNGTGATLSVGTVISTSQTVYIYDETGSVPNCFDEVTFNVTVNSTPSVDALMNQIECDSYTLPIITGTNLSGNEAYYTGPNGTGTVISNGSVITSSQTIYIYDETGTTPNCFDETTFTVTINQTPSIDAIADQIVCDSYTLPAITGTNLTGNESYFTGPNGTGTALSVGTVITSDQTLFIYDETATVPNCFDEVSFNVTINGTPSIDVVANQEVCDSYVLPAITGTNLTGNEAYYTGPNGTGTMLSAGDVITSDQTLYIYDETGSNPNCFDETSFTVTINVTPSLDAVMDQIACDSYVLPAITGTSLTGNESYFTGPLGTGTALSVGDVITTSQTVYIYDETASTPNCFDETSYTITINGTPLIDVVTNQVVCDSYTLPAITGTNLTGNESYFTGPNGTGTALSAGAAITASQTIYIYDETGSVPNCFDETSFTVTVNPTPSINVLGNQIVCDSYTLPVITGTNLTGNESYFTGSLGTGTALSVGDVIATSQTVYIYDETASTPNCFDETSFTITINNTPLIDVLVDQVECDSYTLPAITGINLTGNESFFTGPNGTGTALPAGSNITSTQTIYMFDETGSTPNCFDEVSFLITINATPIYTLTPIDPSVCNASDGSVLIEGLTAGVSYELTYNSGGPNTVLAGQIANGAGEISISGLASGTYNISLVDESSNCQGVLVSTVLNNPGAPILDPIANYVSCAVDYQLLVANITGTGLTGNQAFYSAPGGNAADLIPDGTVLSAPTNTTVYAFDENGTCSSEISFTVEVNENPTALIAPNPAEVCAGLDLAVSGNPVGGSGVYASHSWTGSGASSLNSTLTEDVVFNNGTAGVYNLTYTVTDDKGCIGSDNSVVTVHGNPTANITPDPAEVCAGNDLALNGNPANGSTVYTAHAWTGAGASSLNATNNATAIFNNSTAGNYGLTYTVTDDNGCIGTDNITVLVNPIPTITLTPQNPSSCGGSDGEIEVSGVGTGIVSWTGGANGTSAVVTLPFVISNLSPGSYDVIFTSSAGCVSQIKSTNILNPGAPVITPINDYTSCNINYTVQDPLTSITGSNLTGNQAYYSAPGGLAANVVAPGTVITSAMSPYVLYAYDVDGLCSAEESFVVTVYPEPGSTATNNGPVCEGNPIVLNETSGNGVSWTWSSNGSAVISNVNSQSPTVTNASSNEVFSVTIVDANGCQNTAQTTVTINPLPNVSAGADVSLCEGESVTLNGQGALIYNWDNGVSNGASFTPATTQVYTVVGTDANGCQNSDNVTVTVNEIPVILFDANPTSGCAPLLVDFTNNSTGNLSECIWDLGDGTVLNNCSDFSHTYVNGGDFTVTLTSTTVEGCSSSLTLQDYIHVENAPIASFIPSTTILSETEPEVFLNNTSQGAVSYEWDFGDGSVATSVNPSHEYYTEEPGGYIITLIAYSEMGCSDTAEVFIRVKEELIYYVPNSFTPDGDQFNQTFQPVFTSGFDIYNFNMVIFNRWGEIVFETNDASIGWDGTYTGSIAPDGVYTWKIAFKTSENDERKVLVGHVNLIR